MDSIVRGRRRDKISLASSAAHLAESQVAGPEVVRPLGNAVSLVYTCKGHRGEFLSRGQTPCPRAAAAADKSLRREEQHAHLAGFHLQKYEEIGQELIFQVSSINRKFADGVKQGLHR